MMATASAETRKKASWIVRSSLMAKNAFNPGRKLVDRTPLTLNPNLTMISLTLGDPTVYGNFKTHEIVSNAVVNAVNTYKNNGYGPTNGHLQARLATARYYSRPEAILSAEDVILTCGASEAIQLSIQAIANPGKNILIPRPGFSIYKTIADIYGIECRYYNLIPEKSWEIDLTQLESLIDENTACIVVNNPSNPCGAVFTAEHLREVLAIADTFKLPIISDEIYADLVFPGEKFFPLAALTSTVPILTCGGLSKRWLVPGWRMGWILIHDRNGILHEELVSGLINLTQQILGPNTLLQSALTDIFEKTPQSFFDSVMSKLKHHAMVCFTALSQIPGLNPLMPKGALYMMVGIDLRKFPEFKDDLEFTQHLIEEQSVFLLPSKLFAYTNYMRLVLTVPEDLLRQACHRIAQFCSKHYQDNVTKNS